MKDGRKKLFLSRPPKAMAFKELKETLSRKSVQNPIKKLGSLGISQIMFYFSKDDIIFIHSKPIADFSGSDGTRDAGILDSAIFTPLQTFADTDLCPSVIDKCARPSYILVIDHPSSVAIRESPRLSWIWNCAPMESN